MRALPPIAIGHELSIVLVVALVLGLGLLADRRRCTWRAGIALIAFGIFRFVKPRAHPRWTTMRVNRRELALVVVPDVERPRRRADGRAGADRRRRGRRVGAATTRSRRPAAAARVLDGRRSGSLLHVAAMIAVMGVVAVAGLRPARRGGAAQGVDQPRRGVGGRLRARRRADVLHVTALLQCSASGSARTSPLRLRAPAGSCCSSSPARGRAATRSRTPTSTKASARALLERADEADMKVHLIRRSSRRTALERRSCFLVDVERSWVERHELGDPAKPSTST